MSLLSERACETGLANADVVGILDAIDVPIVVVGRDCEVVRFNRAAETLGITSADIGRPSCELRALSSLPEIEKLCTQSMADGAPCRRELHDGDRWFLVRIAPYTGTDNTNVLGAVITFTNFTAFRASLGQAVYE